MNQVSATFIKVLKDTFRNKSALFWVIAGLASAAIIIIVGLLLGGRFNISSL